MGTDLNKSVMLFDNILLRVEEGWEAGGDRLLREPDKMAVERWLGLPREIGRATDTSPSPVEDVGVDHRRADVLVSEQFLNRPDIIPVFQEMGSERMPEGVAGDRLRDPRLLAGIFDGPLDDGVVEVVPEEATGRCFRKLPVCGKYPLPPP